MPTRRILPAAIALAVVCLGTSSCFFFDDPCGDRYLSGHRGMQGIWRVSLVDDKPIPANGSKLIGTDDYLVVGSVEFEETSVDGTCDDPQVSRGTIIARFILGDGAGHSKPSEAYPGEYTLDHSTNVVTLRALDQQQVGTRSSDHNTFTLPVVDPVTGAFTLTTAILTR